MLGKRALILGAVTGIGRAISAKGLEELLDLSLARSGEDFGGAPNLVPLARWGMFADPLLPVEAMGRL